MDFLELCNRRCSVRDYEDKPVEREKLEYILNAGRLAPSAVNFQPWVFMVVREQENRIKIQECYHRDWFKSAPCYIIICADLAQGWKRKIDKKDFSDIDAAIATEHMCLAATSIGLGTCWVCNFDPESLRSNFHFPDNLDPIAILPVGYPKNPNQCDEIPKVRKPLTEIVRWEKL
ncbi:MAG: nitroreductase family protein [Bacteroidales bacterium]